MNRSTRMRFGDRMSFLMEERALTPADIEKQTGIPRASVALWVSADGIARADTVRTNIVKLCRLFGCSAAFLLGAEDTDGVFNPSGESFIARVMAALSSHGKTLHGLYSRTSVTEDKFRLWRGGYEPLASDIFIIAGYISCRIDELL